MKDRPRQAKIQKSAMYKTIVGTHCFGAWGEVWGFGDTVTAQVVSLHLLAPPVLCLTHYRLVGGHQSQLAS